VELAPIDIKDNINNTIAIMSMYFNIKDKYLEQWDMFESFFIVVPKQDAELELEKTQQEESKQSRLSSARSSERLAESYKKQKTSAE
jgi:hypothetical protein